VVLYNFSLSGEPIAKWFLIHSHICADEEGRPVYVVARALLRRLSVSCVQKNASSLSEHVLTSPLLTVFSCML